jgi:hypothetical protein
MDVDVIPRSLVVAALDSMDSVLQVVKRLRRKHTIIQTCIRQAGYHV